MTILNSSPKATEPNVIKHHVDPPGAAGTKTGSNRPCHMTNMTSVPILGKSI